MSMPVTTVSVSSSVVFGVYRNVLQCLRQLRHGSLEAPSAKLDIFLSGLAGGVAQVTLLMCYYPFNSVFINYCVHSELAK